MGLSKSGFGEGGGGDAIGDGHCNYHTQHDLHILFHAFGLGTTRTAHGTTSTSAVE